LYLDMMFLLRLLVVQSGMNWLLFIHIYPDPLPSIIVQCYSRLSWCSLAFQSRSYRFLPECFEQKHVFWRCAKYGQ
jgi:hypothetical protein